MRIKERVIKTVRKTGAEQLIKGGSILFVGTIITNVINYGFQVAMGRMLTPSEYGIFSALMSILYIILVPSSTVQNTFIPLIAEFNARKELGKIEKAFPQIIKTILKISILGTIIFALSSRAIANFLKIETITPVILLSLLITVSTVLAFNRSVLQGLQNFFKYSLSVQLETFLKLIFGISLVYAGFGANGAISGIAISMAIAYFVTITRKGKSLEKNSQKKTSFLRKKHIIHVSRIFITMLCLIGFYTLDVIMAKHNLSPRDAGIYGALSTTGKIIFFGNAIISQVLLPVSSEKHSKKNGSGKIFFLALFAVTTISIISTMLYYFFPELILKILYGAKYNEASSLLFLFGIFIGTYSMLHLTVTYCIGIKKYTYIPFLIAGVISQVILINLGGNSIETIVKISATTTGITLFLLLLTISKNLFTKKS